VTLKSTKIFSGTEEIANFYNDIHGKDSYFYAVDGLVGASAVRAGTRTRAQAFGILAMW
jgi:hypothetical protein